MITLRTYASPIEAGMAKSMLEAHQISCALADENANAYGGAPFAMPVRLLVNEDQVDAAKEILEDAEKLANSDAAGNESSVKDTVADILDELKNPRYYYGYSYLGYIALERNHLKEAEGYFARAYELFPSSENEQRLQAVRKRLEIEHAR